MSSFRYIWVFMAALIVNSANAGKVETTPPPVEGLTRYLTYSWQDGTPARRPTAEQQIREAVERELLALGLQRVDTNADLRVVSHALVDRHSLAELADSETRQLYTGVEAVDILDLGAGTLVIDLVDPKLDQIVWRAAAGETVRGGVAANLPKIDKMVRKMFKQLGRR